MGPLYSTEEVKGTIHLPVSEDARHFLILR